MRFLLTPRWLALHVAVVAVAVGCVLLGHWQLRSYEESERRQAANRAMRPVPVAELGDPGRPFPADAIGRPVGRSGR